MDVYKILDLFDSTVTKMIAETPTSSLKRKVPLLEEEDLTAPVDLETVKKFKALTEGLAKRMDGFNNPKVEVEEDEDRLIISEDNNNDSAPVPTEPPQNGVGHLPEVSMDQHDQVPEESSTDGSRSSSVSMEGSSGAEGLNTLGQLSAIRGIHVVPLVKDQSPSKTRRKSDLIPAIKFNGQDRWICPKEGCLEDFFELTPFTKHLRGHNQPGGNCVFCDKKLSSQSSLDRHMLVHSGERPFECKVCGLTFTTNGNMHRHRRTHFEGGKEDGVLNRPGEFSTPPPPPMKKRGKRKNADLPSLMPTTKRNCHGIESAQDIAGHMLIHPLNGGGDTIASSTTCHQCGENMYSLENLLVHQRTSPYCQLAAGGSPLVAGAWTTHMNGLHLLGNSAAAATAQSGIRVIIPDEFSVHTPPAHHLAYSYTPSHYSRRYNVTQSPLADVPVKQEDSNSVDDDDCQPLDFSMKSKSRSSEGPAPSPVGAQECPIDLTKATDAATAHKQTTLTN